MARRAKQTKFVALNLRLPPELHKELVEAAGNTRSLNAEILGRLKRSFEPEVKVLVPDRTRDTKLTTVIKHINKELAEANKELAETKNKLIIASTQSLEDLKRRVEKIEERLSAEK